jgi:hypothetical protein
MAINGVTVMPEYFQTEGVESVLDRLAGRARVNAVATSPYVMEPADDKTGSREPPVDAGAGAVRLLDRPLWGRRELFVRTAPSFQPDPSLYRGLRYQPAATSELTAKQGGIIHRVIRAAQARHVKVYLQVQAAIPPGYRVQFGGPQLDDKPRLPDGNPAPRTLANNGSLASPHILDYTCALLKDLLRAYPEVDGLRVDWPEYPPYFLDDVFFDFGGHAKREAARLGYDFEPMRSSAAWLYRTLHGGLTNARLSEGWYGLAREVVSRPALAQWMSFKAALVREAIRRFRAAMNEAGGRNKDLVPGVFPAPWALVSGMDYAQIAPHVSAISVKLYTMHWPVMARFWGDALQKANPQTDPALICRALHGFLEMNDRPAPARLEDWRYPEPDEAHPAGDGAMQRKIRAAVREAGSTPVYAIAHGYGPSADYIRRYQAAKQASPHGVWVNRYGYLSNAKLDAMGRVP